MPKYCACLERRSWLSLPKYGALQTQPHPGGQAFARTLIPRAEHQTRGGSSPGGGGTQRCQAHHMAPPIPPAVKVSLSWGSGWSPRPSDSRLEVLRVGLLPNPPWGAGTWSAMLAASGCHLCAQPPARKACWDLCAERGDAGSLSASHHGLCLERGPLQSTAGCVLVAA